MMVAAMKTFTTHSSSTMWPTSRSPHLTFHLIPNVTNTHWQACVCARFCHGVSLASVNPQSHIRCDNLSCFSTDAVEKTSTITQKNTVTSVVRQAGRPALFTCGPCVDVDVITPCCVQQKEGCGSAGGSTSSNPLVFKLWPTCMNLAYDSRGTVVYVTSRSVCDGCSSTAAARGTGTGTGTAHEWVSQQTQPKTSASDWDTAV